MKTTYSTPYKLRRMFANILSIFVILALAFPVTGGASAEDGPSPWLIAFPENEAIEGWEWPENASIALTINNAPGYQWNGIAEVTSWGDPRTYVRIEFGNDYDLKVGDEVTLTDGFGTTITHTVQNLSVSLVNTKADTVTGTADPGAVVQAWPHGFDQIATVQVIAGDNGGWQANFGGAGFNIVEEIGGRSQIIVEGSATAVDWDAHQTYDIYAYDPLTRTIQQITYLANTDEYNPSWSPNGKKVAHDVVYWDGSHGIYITDVKTGVSAPLFGAEDGGNDAVWSPNGTWIAFDRHWVGDSSLYIVPSTGGNRTLVRSDAISADWAPSGKRLVFQDQTDGSIRTIPVNRGKGGETTIAASGANPSWSPDGNWIAYENNGDIWKVQVNVQGNTFGNPIQVTSGPFEDGQPTWSADSMTIVYHSGFTGDWDLWTVPAAGGVGTWLNGAPELGDYDPAYARNSSNVAYASFSPDGQAARLWVSAFTYDPPAGTFSEGTHPYHFQFDWSIPEPGSWSGQEGDFVVSAGADIYNGYVLLRGPAELHGINYPSGFTCEQVDDINPSQPTRFLIGWVPGIDEATEMTYPEAKAHFESITATAVWDGGSAELARHEIIPYREDNWFDYVCTFTEAPLKMDLRVNYGHDWVESFYEAGHAVTVTLTESDGLTVKATAELVTEPKDYWGGEPGFQTNDTTWFDAEGNPLGNPPDIRAYDWVYAQVDNGATAKVQIGEINGTIDLAADSVQGTVLTPWFSAGSEVNIECHPWGSPTPVEMKFDTVLPNGADTYSCLWSGEWDIQPGQDVGVGYFGPDGHWVANAISNPYIWAFPVANQVFGYGWPKGSEVSLTINEKFIATATVQGAPWNENDVMAFFDFGGLHDLATGDVVTLSGSGIERTHTVQNLAVTDINVEPDTVSGTADSGAVVHAWVHEFGYDTWVTVKDGSWSADFGSDDFHLQPGMCGRAEIPVEGRNSTNVDWCVPNTRFTVWPEQDYLEGYEWPEGAAVSISVAAKDVCSAEVVPGYQEWDPSNTFFSLNFPDDCDIAAGDLITLSSERFTFTHQVGQLAVTEVNLDLDTVTGTAVFDPEQYILHTWIHGVDGSYMQLSAEGGTWLAEFGFELQPGMGGRVELVDQHSNATAVEWHIPNPHFSVFPEWDYVEGWEWPDGATVSAAIEGKSACSVEGISGHPNWDPNALFVPLWFPEDCDVAVDDVVTLTDSVTTRTHTVQDLAITAVDKDADTITGTADPGATVHVWPHGYNELLPTADGDGNWIADFTEPGPDLVEGMGGRTEIRDEFGNATAVEWRILNPFIEAAPYSDWIHAREWPIGTLMTLEIDDPSDGLGDVDYSATATMQQAPWNPNDPTDILADFRWPDEFAPGPGYVLTMSGNGQSKTLTISNLKVTGFDLDFDTISGTGTPNARIQVCANIPNRCMTRWLTADGDGNWTADYKTWAEGDDPEPFDVQLGSNGWAAGYESDSDRTWFDWWVPNPRFVVFPEWEWFDGNDWPDGATVDITVENKPECTTSKVSSGFFFNGSFGEDCDVVVGDVVTFSDGSTIRTHTVRKLAISLVDQAADTVSGLSDPNETVYVWQHESGPQIPFEANASGEWFADLNGYYDIRPGLGGRSEIRDEVGNSTAVDWWIPNPRITVFPESEYLQGYDWPDGATVTITVEGKPQCLLERESWGGFFDGNFPEGCDLVSGDTVTYTDGPTTRIHIVRNLSITAVDMAADTIAGTANIGDVVSVGAYDFGGESELWLTVEDGSWLADFVSKGINLVEVMCGYARIHDEVGNWTQVDWCVPLLNWQQINASGFGDPQNIGVTALEIFNDQLYAGASNWNIGGQVWRLGEDDQWTQVDDAGFGSGPANAAIIDLAVFQDQLYAGAGWNGAPGQIWRSSDGTTWEPVTTDGFADAENIAVTNFIVFQDMLYVGTGSTNIGSAQIWRSSTGNGDDWTQVAPNEAGLAGNVTGFAVYNDELYAAVEPVGGLGAPIQVWRSTNGSGWTTVTADGFGDERNESTGGFAQFGGYLYLGTRNEQTGAQLWRTMDGTNWDQVVSNGFGDMNNLKIESLFVYNDILYAATLNLSMGLQFWRSADGMNWEPVTANGFGDSNNFSTLWNNTTTEYQGQLLIGTWNNAEGGELWRFTP